MATLPGQGRSGRGVRREGLSRVGGRGERSWIPGGKECEEATWSEVE